MSPATIPDVASLALQDKVWSPNANMELTVVGLGYGEVPAEDVLAGRASPIEARLSADGRSFICSRWHEGEPSEEAVYVERITAEGRAFHGFIDSRSRRLVQAG